MHTQPPIVALRPVAAVNILNRIRRAKPDDEPLTPDQKERLTEAYPSDALIENATVPMRFYWALGMIEWRPIAIRDLSELSPEEHERICEQVRRIAETGEADIRKIKGRTRARSDLAFRVGTWRVFFEVDHGVLRIIRVLPRNAAYRKA